jgi:hypothetical protein
VCPRCCLRFLGVNSTIYNTDAPSAASLLTALTNLDGTAALQVRIHYCNQFYSPSNDAHPASYVRNAHQLGGLPNPLCCWELQASGGGAVHNAADGHDDSTATCPACLGLLQSLESSSVAPTLPEGMQLPGTLRLAAALRCCPQPSACNMDQALLRAAYSIMGCNSQHRTPCCTCSHVGLHIRTSCSGRPESVLRTSCEQ